MDTKKADARRHRPSFMLFLYYFILVVSFPRSRQTIKQLFRLHESTRLFHEDVSYGSTLHQESYHTHEPTPLSLCLGSLISNHKLRPTDLDRFWNALDHSESPLDHSGPFQTHPSALRLHPSTSELLIHLYGLNKLIGATNTPSSRLYAPPSLISIPPQRPSSRCTTASHSSPALSL